MVLRLAAERRIGTILMEFSIIAYAGFAFPTTPFSPLPIVGPVTSFAALIDVFGIALVPIATWRMPLSEAAL